MVKKDTLFSDYIKSTTCETTTVNSTAKICDIYRTLASHESIYGVLNTRSAYVRDIALQSVADAYFDGNYDDAYNLWIN